MSFSCLLDITVVDAVENKLRRTTNFLFVDGLHAFEADLDVAAG